MADSAPYHGSVTEEKNEGLTISHGLIVFLKLPFLISGLWIYDLQVSVCSQGPFAPGPG